MRIDKEMMKLTGKANRYEEEDKIIYKSTMTTYTIDKIKIDN